MASSEQHRVDSGTGDGDLIDPLDLTDDALAGTGSADLGSVPGSVTDAEDDDTSDYGDERASEVDDSTGPIDRPTAAGLADGELMALLTERDEYKQLAQRIQADFDNFRKRSIAQTQADVDRATGRLVEALLPVLDAAEAAYLRHPDEVGPLLNQMLLELRKQGLEVLDLDGKRFDPEVAEAVAHEPGEGGDPVVAEVLRSGYQWKGRTLRAAMVRTRDESPAG